MLYKVTLPREDHQFFPSKFWRTEDWSSSSNRPHDGYIEDEVLYVGDFAEVNIHLFPKVRRLRFWRTEATEAFMHDFSFAFTDGSKAVIVADSGNEELVYSFTPTIYRFLDDGFVRVRNGEYISRKPQTAIGVDSVSFTTAMQRWQFDTFFTEDYDTLVASAIARQVYFDEQT